MPIVKKDENYVEVGYELMCGFERENYYLRKVVDKLGFPDRIQGVPIVVFLKPMERRNERLNLVGREKPVGRFPHCVDCYVGNG